MDKEPNLKKLSSFFGDPISLQAVQSTEHASADGSDGSSADAEPPLPETLPGTIEENSDPQGTQSAPAEVPPPVSEVKAAGQVPPADSPATPMTLGEPSTDSPTTPTGISKTPSPNTGGNCPDIPYKDDTTATQPKPGILRLSEAAINQRMGRVFQPSKRTGEYKVSDKIVAMYKSKGGKPKLHQIFQSCGYNVDSAFLKQSLYVFWCSMFFLSGSR